MVSQVNRKPESVHYITCVSLRMAGARHANAVSFYFHTRGRNKHREIEKEVYEDIKRTMPDNEIVNVKCITVISGGYQDTIHL